MRSGSSSSLFGAWPRSRAHRAALALGLAVSLGVGGCATTGATGDAEGASSSSSSSVEQVSTSDAAFWDATQVHSIEITADETEVAAMIATYLESGEKEWLSATVTIDGTTYENVGIKLKGNSSLRGISAETPLVELPWRIRFDKYVDGQTHEGITDITVRSNNTETSLNEAVALDLLAEAGLASEEAAATRLSVNGSEEDLRLTVQNLNEEWVAENFPDAGADSVLYKAESEGTWEWQGEDADYSSSFDLEAGPDNYEPLIALLDLINNGTEEEIAEQLPAMVDLESFATYLAFQELIDNFDDIDGPGNNAYLFWDSATSMFTVVAWDHNLAFGMQNGGEGGDVGGGMPGGRGDWGDQDQQADDGAASDSAEGEASEGAGSGMVPPGSGAESGGAGSMPTDLPSDFPTDGSMPTDMPTDATMPEGMTGEMPQMPEGMTEGEMPQMPEGGQMPGGGGDGAQGFGGGMGGGGMTRSNPLVNAFQANEEWAAMLTAETERLQADLVDSGAFEDSLAAWTAVLEEGATDLVDAATIESESEAIGSYAG